MLNADGDRHRRLRALGAVALTTERLRAGLARAARLAEERLDRITARDHADLVRDFARPFAVSTVTELYGYPPEFARRVRTLPRLTPSPVFSPAGSPERRRYGAEREAVSELLHDLVAVKRRRPGPDAVSDLIARADAEGFDDGELTSTLFLLLVAACEPVSDFLTASLYSLWQRPTLLADHDLVTAGTDELLRFTSPLAATMPRFATRTTELAGIELEAGDAVLLHLALANRDPARFARPNRLELSRAYEQDVVFAHGPHYCLGTHLAVPLCRTALAAVLRRLPGLTAARPLETLPWHPGSTGTLTHLHVAAGLQELPVTFETRPPRRPHRAAFV
nr:cytochrome P450 [Streptomyces albus]